MKTVKKTLEKALGEAGEILKRGFAQPKKVAYKSPISLVTETDKKAERVIIDIIKRAFPAHAILAEESAPQGNSLCKWIIDPIDGTTNFAHGLPEACVTIAYEEAGNVRLGGVWNPFRNEWFWAEKGRGASLNGKRIRVSKARHLGESLVATGFPYDRRTYSRFYLLMMESVLNKTHDVRRFGSAALDLCAVASGRYDAYWEFKLCPWDQAAGVLIVQEAGGRVSNFAGKPVSIYTGQTVASNGIVHDELLRTLRRSISSSLRSKSIRAFNPLTSSSKTDS